MFISINADELLLITISMKMKRYIILNNIKLNDGIEICFSAMQYLKEFFLLKMQIMQLRFVLMLSIHRKH